MITETSTRVVDPDITVVSISGALSLGNTLLSIESSLRKSIDQGCRKLVLDLTGLQFIDSAAIGMLVSCNGHMELNGGHLRLAGAHGLPAKVFGLVHMDRIVALHPDVDAACGSFPK